MKKLLFNEIVTCKQKLKHEDDDQYSLLDSSSKSDRFEIIEDWNMDKPKPLTKMLAVIFGDNLDWRFTILIKTISSTVLTSISKLWPVN
ncbi:Microtubule-associated protein RP/EB family member [Dirofilaria immitis]